MKCAARRVRDREGTGVVEHLRRSFAGPFVLDEVPGELLDEQTLDRRVSVRPPHVEAERYLQRLDLVEAFRQLSEDRPPLVHGEAGGEHSLLRLLEELAHDDAGVARRC